MGFKDVTDGVQTLLGSTPVILGPQGLSQVAQLPRVVFVPTAERFTPAQSLDEDSRQLWTRRAGCSVHLWHQDVPSVEALLNQVVAAIHNVAGAPNYQLDGEASWLDQQGSLGNEGLGYAFHVSLLIPVTEAPPQIVTVTSVPQTNQMETVDWAQTPPATVDEDAG